MEVRRSDSSHHSRFFRFSGLADAILDRVVHSSHKIELKATKSLRDTAQAQPA
jgi:hypothetical protein